MDDSVTPIDSRPRLIKGDVNYTQIVVDRARALDGTIHDVMFVSTGGSLGKNMGTSSSGSVVKNPPANARDTGSMPGLGRSLGEGKGTRSSVLVRRIPQTEEPGGLQFIGLQKVRHDLSNQTIKSS